jgi:putative aldouronate transport system permease protein
MSKAKVLRTNDERVFDVVKTLFVGLFTLFVVIPIVHIIGVAFAAPSATARGITFYWPSALSLGAFERVLETPTLVTGLRNSFVITVGGTALAMALTTTLAYGLSVAKLPGVRFFNLLVVFTMVFNPGLIPLYLVVRSLGLLNTQLSVITVLAINPFFAIILRNFFETIPKEMHESAYMDGASEPRIFWSIMLPLATPALAAITLFYAVMYWNSFFQALMFITESNLWPIQVWLRELLNDTASGMVGQQALQQERIPAASLRMAVVLFAMLPIVMVYPFLQKHFAKGIMLGAVKG